MNERDKKVYIYLRRVAARGRPTPPIPTITKATGYGENSVKTALAVLRMEGVIVCEWKPGSSIRRMHVKTKMGWRWTTEPQIRKSTGRRPWTEIIEEWGGGRIARMTPTKQDEAINRVFAGRKFESYRFKR